MSMTNLKRAVMVNNIHEVVPKARGKVEVYKVKFKDLQLCQLKGKSRILEQQHSTDKFLNVNFHSSNIGKRTVSQIPDRLS